MIISTFTIIWGVYTLIWLVIVLIRYLTARKAREILKLADFNLSIMSYVLAKFKRGEIPLDKEIIKKHFQLFDAAEQSFRIKTNLFEEFDK